MNPEIVLDREDESHLMSIISQPGFKVLTDKVMKPICDQFIMHMINTGEGEETLVLARHKLAKAAAQYFSEVLKAVNEVRSTYIASSAPQKPVDTTEGILDLDSISEMLNRDESYF